MDFVFLKKYLTKKLKNIGSTAIEYALIAALISIAAIGGYKALGNKYGKIYNDIHKAL